MVGLKERVITDLHKRRQNILEGKINSIPSPFIRFSEDFIGIEQATYYGVTATTKGAKSQFVSKVFIYHALMYAYENQDKLKLKIFYFPLEETPERILQRFMSYILFKKFNIRISPRDLRSSRNDHPVSEEVLQYLEDEEIVKILTFFEENVIFSTETNPTGIYKFCMKYAQDNGTTYTNKIQIVDDLGNSKEIETFDHYEPNDPTEYKLIIIDTINLIDTEKGLTLKQSMDKLSEYLAKKLRNRYGFSPVVIQQQAFDQEGIENIKLNKLRPSVAGLGDSKYIGRDANIVLGLFSPARFDLKEYLGYDITKFNDNIRFLEVCVNRDGSLGGIIALYFDGAVCEFAELPKPDNLSELTQVYKYMNLVRSKPIGTKLFFIRTLNRIKQKWQTQ